MKGYVYMIDYFDTFNCYDDPLKDYDQIECADKKDLLTQCKLLSSEYIVERIKLVNDKDRYVEKEISKSLYATCKKILKGRLL